MWSCEGSKILGPDGFYFLFVKKCWHFIIEDVISCFNDFHSGAVLSKSFDSSFLTLISKLSNPLGLDDYRHICLVDFIYKFLSKWLASRTKRVLFYIIFQSQSAFVPGKQLVDGMLVSNEVVDFTNKEGR